jgi:hypothetical protein
MSTAQIQQNGFPRSQVSRPPLNSPHETVGAHTVGFGNISSSIPVGASMLLRFLALFLLLSCCRPYAMAQCVSPEAKPSAATKPDWGRRITPSLTQEQIKALVREVADRDIENDKRQRDYTYIERDEEHRLNGKGAVTSTEIKTYEILEVYGEQVQRLIAKNDQPLSEKERAKEEEKVQKIINKRKDESDSDREKRLKKEEKDREEGREFVKEVADAYNFKLVSMEKIDGRDTYVIDAEPRPGFEPHKREAKALTKMRGRIWIDTAEHQWVRMDAEVLDTISFGLFLARLHKGTRINVALTRVNDEVWLPKNVSAKVDVRLALLKNFDVDLNTTYRDYKKFRTATRITGVDEVHESPH